MALACNGGRLSEEHFGELLPYSSMRMLHRGDLLFEQGKLPHSMYWVRRGLLKVCRSTGTGRDLITELLFPGDLCGVLCGLDCNGYPVSAIALTETEVAVIPRDRFLEHATDRVMTASTEICRGKVRFQREMMVGMAVERADQRAARVLLMLYQRLAEPGARDFPLPLSRQELSELIGTTLETAIRVMSRFRRDGLIAEKNDRLVILQPEALHELAQD